MSHMPLGGRKDTLVLGGESMSTRGSTGSEVARIAAEVGAETRSPVSVREFSGTGKWSKRGSTRSSGGAKQLPAPPGDDKPKARPSDVAEPEPAKEQATAEPATVWQAVLLSNRGGAQVKVDDRFKHVWEAIRSKTAALTERLKLNYQSKSLTSNLRKLEKLTDTDTARQQEKTRGQRKRNRINAAVVSKLDEWWECMPKDSEGVINKSIYTWASQLLFYAFVPGSTEDDCQMCIAEDWRTDSKGKKILNKQMFSDAMFQFADVWCESAEYREYVDLLAACIAICSRGPAYVPVEKEDDEDLPTDVRAPAPMTAIPRPGRPQTRKTPAIESAKPLLRLL
ncbi:hypothetical protein DIPPA_10074 [Diplonema papillatum]|nr:hypothetical protein DIPPA_10074 [Diplonema papillatum]